MKLQVDQRVWGEETGDEGRQDFLESRAERTNQTKQPKLVFLRGNAWMAYQLAKELTWQAVDESFYMQGVSNWEECEYGRERT